MFFILLGWLSRFLKISLAFSEAKASSELYLFVIRIKMAPVTDPMLSHRD